MVVIDATFLLLIHRPETLVPPTPDGRPVDSVKERVTHLLYELDRTRTKIIIPTPALAEALVRAGAAASQEIVEHFQKYSAYQIQPFDQRAAIEVAAMTRVALATGNKRGSSDATWAKVKYDRQIVAIAKVAGATTIYSDDRDIAALAGPASISVIGIADLPLPPPKPEATPDMFAGLPQGGPKRILDTE